MAVTITVAVRRFATLRPKDAPPETIMTLPVGSTVAEVMDLLALLPAQVQVIVVNGRKVGAQQRLTDGDVVGLFPAVVGG